MFRKIPHIQSLLLLLLLVSPVASAQETRSETNANEGSSSVPFAHPTSVDDLPDNWYAWNLLRKNETWANKYVSVSSSWAHNENTPDASKTLFSTSSVSLAFFKPKANEDGSKNYSNYMYALLNLDFTPLTLGGLYVEAGAVGTTDQVVDPTKPTRDYEFSIVGSKAGGTYYLNILSASDSEGMQNPNSGKDSSFISTPVNFDVNDNFTLGSASIPFTGVNIYSDWNINVAKDKTLKIYGELRGGSGTTITLSNGGQVSLFKANYLLKSDWHLKGNTKLKFEAAVATEDSTITSTNLLGSGKLTVENGILEIAGKGATINNQIIILEGGKLTVQEKVRNFGPSVTTEEFQKIAYYVNVTGSISGKGTFFRNSEGGKNATNEVWVFTGDNSNFSGNWETNADVDYYGPDNKYVGDKVYDYIPIVFGNGSAFKGNNFYAIAGTGSIIGLLGQNSRIGMGVGFNYGSNVILYNNLGGTLKIRHLSKFILELKGHNTHGYGTYATGGGTIRFTEASNLGSMTVASQTGGFMVSGGTVALNNGSIISFGGNGTVSLRNALFNTEGNWGIQVENSGATLNWDLSSQGIYDHFSTSDYKGSNIKSLNDAKRTGDFTKTGAGTLVITAGKLITSKENHTANNRTIHVKEGKLAFSGQGTWGDAAKIVLYNGVILDVNNRDDHTLTLSSKMTLTSDKTSHIKTTSTIDGNLTLNAQSIVEFVMLWRPFDLATQKSQFNSFDINGIFNLSGTANADGKRAIFQFTFLNGLYVNQEGFYLLLMADNDLRQLDLTQIDLAGLPKTNSRQSYKLYASGAEWVDSKGITQKGYGDANGKELYLYASPDTASLTWNKATGGTWELLGSNDNRASWDAKGQTIEDNDTRFYHSDAVIFGDNAGDVAGKTKKITIVGEVLPANVIVKGSGHYSFEGTGSIGGQADLVKEGTGTLDIWTSNSYSAGTFVNAGTINAYAENSFGSGLIRVNTGAILNIGRKDGNTIVGANNALGSADLTISGGTLNIYTTNSAARNTILESGGFIYAYGSNSLGSGSLFVNNGTVYARGSNAIGGNVFVTGANSHLYTESVNALGGTTVTVSNGGIIHSAKEPQEGWSMGKGSTIILSDGGILEVNSSTALNDLSTIKFDGGEMRVDNRKVDATGFNGTVELSNAKKAIINTIGEESQLTLNGQLGTMITAHILKKGEGELVGVLKGNFLAAMEIAGGSAHLIQGKDASGNYTKHQFTGDLLGTGRMAFSGGGIFVSSNMVDFDGELYINLDRGQDFLIQTHHADNEELFDVTINQGNFWIDDNSGSNTLHCGNLSSGTGAFASESKIGMNPLIDPATVRGGALVSVMQTLNKEFKGIFVNGQSVTDKTSKETRTLTTSLEKMGAATLTLTGDSTATGTMSIAEGAIKLGNGGATGFWAGKIINDSKLIMDYGHVTKTYSQEISGAGSMQISTGTTGNVIFTANNTYSGGTSITNGNVQLKDQGTLGTGEIVMSGTSALDVTNKNGVENRTIRVATASKATIKTAKLGDTGVLTSAANDSDHAAISVRKGTLDDVTLVTSNGKATLSGVVTGTSITLDAGSATRATATTPFLSNITLGLGSVATANNGTSNVINRLTLNYGAGSITGAPGSMGINDAKLALGVNGSYNISGITRVEINLDQASMNQLTKETRLTIHVFGQGADMSNVFTETGTSGLSNILLNDLLKNEDWSVLLSSIDQKSDTAWWKTGDIILVKGQVVPEPSSAMLVLASALMMSLRRRRRN